MEDCAAHNINADDSDVASEGYLASCGSVEVHKMKFLNRGPTHFLSNRGKHAEEQALDSHVSQNNPVRN